MSAVDEALDDLDVDVPSVDYARPFRWLAIQTGSVSKAAGVAGGGMLLVLFASAGTRFEPVGFAVFILGTVLTFAGMGDARETLFDPSPYDGPDPETRTVAGEVTRVIEPDDLAHVEVGELTRERARGHRTLIVEPDEPDDDRGSVLPWRTHHEAVIVDETLDVQEGDRFEGGIREATIETTVDAHVPAGGRVEHVTDDEDDDDVVEDVEGGDGGEGS